MIRCLISVGRSPGTRDHVAPGRAFGQAVRPRSRIRPVGRCYFATSKIGDSPSDPRRLWTKNEARHVQKSTFGSCPNSFVTFVCFVFFVVVEM